MKILEGPKDPLEDLDVRPPSLPLPKTRLIS